MQQQPTPYEHRSPWGSLATNFAADSPAATKVLLLVLVTNLS
jgi:hypothetical protein